MRLPVDVGFGDMVKINEHELAYTAARQRLRSPRAYPANANDSDASLPDARGTDQAIESLQTDKAALQIGCLRDRIAQTARSNRQFWYLRAMTMLA